MEKNISELKNSYIGIVGEDAYLNDNITIKSITKDYSSKFDTLQVCFISDLHIGSCDFDLNGLIESLEYANSHENAVIFILGDALNSAIVGSKSDAYEDIMSPQEQLDFFGKVLELAKGDKSVGGVIKNLTDSGKIAVIHSGNHEDRIRKAVGISPTKMVAENASMGALYAPYFAFTDLVLRQPLARDGKYHFGVVTHHGTGISNIDGTIRLLRNVNNANLCVIGHTHQHSMKASRFIQVDKTGQQRYHDIVCLTLPASGGGTYGAGMALPDIAKQTAVWLTIGSEPCSYAGKLSPTGIAYPDFVPAISFFTPSNSLDTFAKRQRSNATKRAIAKFRLENEPSIKEQIDQLVDGLIHYEDELMDSVIKAITEKRKPKPRGYDEYIASINEESEMGDE